MAVQTEAGHPELRGARANLKEMSRGRALVLSYLLKLNKSIDANHADLVHAIVQRFNEALVDYVSYGYFRLLEQCDLEDHQLVAIDKTTQQALHFGDTHAARAELDLRAMKRDLEALAFALEVRFEIEDEVVAAIAA